MKLHFPCGLCSGETHAVTPEMLARSGYARLNDLTADVTRLRTRVQTAKDARFCWLALGWAVFCVGVIALAHLYPGVYSYGIGMALVWTFTAIGDVFVSCQQAKLALAILAQRSLAECLRDGNEGSSRCAVGLETISQQQLVTEGRNTK